MSDYEIWYNKETKKYYNKKLDCNKMSFEKCECCPYSANYYGWCSGLSIICKITGDVLEVKECVECLRKTKLNIHV